jgi:hypothetical protein
MPTTAMTNPATSLWSMKFTERNERRTKMCPPQANPTHRNVMKSRLSQPGIAPAYVVQSASTPYDRLSSLMMSRLPR